MTNEKDIKEETRRIPACCQTCGHYKPQFWRVRNKECAAFGTVDGVKDDRCGAWCKKIPSPKFG